VRRNVAVLVLLLCTVALSGCPSAVEPGVKPPKPQFIMTSSPPEPIDHGIYADPGLDFIVMEWASDPTRTTTGYNVFRSPNDTIGSDGLLRDRTQLATIESPNQLFETLDTSFTDSLGAKNYEIANFYQVQAYHTSGSNNKTYSDPSSMGSFALLPKPTLNSPSGGNFDGSSFSWNDIKNGGDFQLIVRTADLKAIVWSSGHIFQNGSAQLSITYPTDGTALPLVAGQSYQWRVKKIGTKQGSSSSWQNFSVK
jgi:hypothetical protein